MNKIAAALLSSCMLLATGSSFAQDAMKKEKDAMAN